MNEIVTKYYYISGIRLDDDFIFFMMILFFYDDFIEIDKLNY